MPKINRSVELVTSTIKSLSSMGRQSRLDAKAVLEQVYQHVRITDIRTFDDLYQLLERQPDLAFLGMKFVIDDSGSQPKKVWLAEHLREAGIAYTGSDSAASALEHDKLLSKQRVAEAGLATAQSLRIPHGHSGNLADVTLPYPLFVKPVDGGGGSGINDHSLVQNAGQLQQQLDWLFARSQSDALLETYLPGREFSVGVLKKRFFAGYHTLPLEIVAPLNQVGERFLSSRVKQADTEQTFAVTDQQLRRDITTLALGAFEALGASDYGRIDIRLDARGIPHFLEANLLPSLLDQYGNLPKAAHMNIGLSHRDLILRIAEMGLSDGHAPEVSQALTEGRLFSQ